MAENRPPSKSGREGSPLWANVGTGGFDPGQIPLLVPFNAAPVSETPPPQPDAEEVDHFIGQVSPALTPTSRNDSNVALFAGDTNADNFQVGFGAAPLSTLESTANISTPATSYSQDVYSEPKPSAINQTTQQPQSLVTTQQYYDAPPQSITSNVPMFNPSQGLPTGPQTTVANMAVTPYSPVVHHWYYCKKIANQDSWISFSHLDSMTLEESFLNGEPDVVQTDGGRFDVSISERQRKAVYWNEDACETRRCSWFYRDDATMKYIPYSEEVSEELEEVYMQTTQNNSWHKRNELESTRELFVFHSPSVFVQFNRSSFPDDFGAPFSETARPKVVKRGTDDLDPITNGEPQQIDELVFVVHGIGPVCDLKFRNIVECVDDMRNTGMTILSSHFSAAKANNKVGRVEFLPIYWYDALRNDAVGVDRRLAGITLPSISKIRDITNEVLLDILFYNSPLYSQSILDRVGGELNRLHALFLQRNPNWAGKVSVAGHSLGSLVLFDLLSMQGVSQPAPPPSAAPLSAAVPSAAPLSSAAPPRNSTPASEVTSERSETATPVDGLVAIETLETVLEHLALTNLCDKFHEEQIDLESLIMCSEDDLKSIGLPLGPRKKILKFVAERENKLANKQKVEQEVKVLNVPVVEVAPIPGVETSASHHNWLVETASNTQVGYVSGLNGVGFPLVQYPQLNFHVSKFFAMGSPIAMFLTIRGVDTLSRDFQLPTCSAFFNLFHPFDPVAYRIEPLINPQIKQKPVLMPHHKGRKRLHLELKENLVKVGADIKDRVMKSIKSTWSTINDFARAHTGSNQPKADEQEAVRTIEQAASGDDTLDGSHIELESVSSIAEGEVEVGMLNQGRRIDYVLQEAPFESFNDYLFALSSHLVYWESEDVSLMMMKEIYAPIDVHPDAKLKAAASKNTPSSANSSDFVTFPPPATGVSYPSQPPAMGASYPSQPPAAGARYPSQPPVAGVGYPSQPPAAGASYPSQPPATGVRYPSQPPVTGVSYPSQPPVAGASYPSQPPVVGASYPSQPPSTVPTYEYEPPVRHSQPVQPTGPPPLSGFVANGPPRSGFLPRQ